VSETPPIVTTVLVPVLLLPLDVWRARTVSPFETEPDDPVKLPLALMSYVPPLTVIVDVVSIPATVIAAEVIVLLVATSF
jgi:hypothetical protein